MNAAKMLAELQPCAGGVDGEGTGGATVSPEALGVGGYSLGAGRAVRGAAGRLGRDIIKAVVALHTWDGGYFTAVPSPLMIVSGTEDTNAPYRDTKLLYDRATGPKIVGVLEGSNHYTSPRFWAGPMTAFFLTHLAGDAEAEKYAWGPSQGLESNPRITNGEHACGGWRSRSSAVCPNPPPPPPAASAASNWVW